MLDDGSGIEREQSERELLDVIGPEIERREMRRQFRNFIVFLAAVLGFFAIAYCAWRFFGSPAINLF
jgi:hypothetical protein